ncbi:MAG: polysaccharide deacetylase family protein, partial [Spirochaetales bacterium]|nr:polysaccharide deacetylase family protein [Spirochaetales bacterium]
LKIREEILKLDQLDLENELNKLFADYKINWTRQCEKLCMSWDDISAFKNEPLVTIGAHTQHHYNLKALAAETDVRQEVENGVKILKEKAGIDSTVFAYPFGSDNEAGEREFEVLSKMSFSLACRATGGACFQTDARNMYSLPRIMFKHDFKIEDLQ